MAGTPDLPTEARVQEVGTSLWRATQGARPSLFDTSAWEARLLDRVVTDPRLKVDVFRLLDVLPSLRTPEQVVRHVREYLLPHAGDLPDLFATALKLAASGVAPAVAAHAIRGRVEHMARRFIAGRDPEDALPRLRGLHREGLAFTVSLLGEVALSEVEVQDYERRYEGVLDTLSTETASWPGEPRPHLSLKLSTLDPELEPAAPDRCVARLLARALPLCRRAREKGAFVHLDMEQWDLRALTLDFFEELSTSAELRSWPHLGVTVQAYLRSARRDVDRLASISRARGTPFVVRLVKGAYWDREVACARQAGRTPPVFLEKAATDASYEELAALLARNGDALLPAYGSHNLRTLAHAESAAEASLPPGGWEFQMLYGMAEPERKALRERGRTVRVYAPVGDLVPGMAYLVRRLLENTANNSFLRLSHRENASPETLLARPAPAAEEEAPPSGPAACPLTDFTDAKAREAVGSAVAEWADKLPVRVPVAVAGGRRTAGATLERSCPGDLSRKVALVTLGTADETRAAVDAAWAAWPAWRDRPVEQRAKLLERLGELLERDRSSLAALQVWEEAKPWREADADVAEAVDYCRYYAARAREDLSPRKLLSPPGEENWLLHEGRGPCAVIAPWNFPLAILTGMAAAALVSGNTVVLKPAEQSSAVAFALYERLLEAWFPETVVQFLPGLGETVGPPLVTHPLVAQVAFTGSNRVGLQLVEQAARTVPGQPQVRRVVCEMGGKNAVIVDEDADLDEAVPGVLASAFGYAGQKCSACSRVVTVASVREPFRERLVEACKTLAPRSAADPSCRLPPVIDEEAFARLRAVLRDPGAGARLLFAGEVPPGLPEGWYVPPAVFEVDSPAHPLAQEELFGPVLTLLHARDFEGALGLALESRYALTGAVYSRSPGNLELARQRFRVGNLYVNRPCTGAVVGRQPFGGLRMSGIGTKAGGPGYLLHFTDPRVVTENTLRRGFAPEA